MDAELGREFLLDDEVVIRPWHVDDVDTVFAAVARNRDHLSTYMHWMAPEYSADAARSFIEESIRGRTERRNLGFGIFRRTRLLGSVGFVNFDWPARKTEIGYWIDHDEQGKGIVTRSCQLLIGYAFNELDLYRIEIRCSVENLRSRAIAIKLGFSREGVLRKAEYRSGRLHDFEIYGLLATDERIW